MTSKKDLTIGQGAASSDRVTRMAHEETLEVGSYWCATENAVSVCDVQPGTVLILGDVHEVDGAVHSVEMIEHPRDWHRPDSHGTFSLLLAEFLEAFRAEPDGDRVRDAELAQVQKAVTEQEADLDALRLGLTVDQSAGSTNLPVLVDRRQDLTRHAEQLQDQASLIEATANHLLPFVHEKVLIAKLRARGVGRWIGRLNDGLKTIGLYTGEDVDVVPLVYDGAKAATSEPLHLFQRLLYMDEESLINAATGGADFRDLEAFGELLRSDSSVLERVAPYPRCVVAMQFRYRSRDYGGDPITNMLLNAENKKAFLLIRNGHNVHAVFSSLEYLHRLFPTSDEFDKPFRGIDGRRITLADLEYVGARAAADNLALYYKRILILLCGLYDRTDLLGDFDVDLQKGRMSLLSEDVQNAVFRFVADDEPSLTEGRAAFEDWVTGHNVLVQSGSRVLCVWDELIDQHTAPGCFSRHIYHESQRCFMPENGHDACVVYRREQRFFVRIGVRGWAPWGRNEREFQAQVEIKPGRHHSLPYLCLDAVDPSDVDYYLNSREARRGYLEYAKILFAVKQATERDRHREQPLQDALTAALIEGNVVDSTTQADSQVREAMRQWRAKHRGAELPQPMDAAYDGVMRTLMHWLWMVNNHGRDRYGEVADLLATEARSLITLHLSGTAKLTALATAQSDELDPRLGEHRFVVTLDVKEKKTKLSLGQRRWLLPTTPRPHAVPIRGNARRASRFCVGELFVSTSDTDTVLRLLRTQWDRVDAWLAGEKRGCLVFPVAGYKESVYRRIEVVWGCLEDDDELQFRCTGWARLLQGSLPTEREMSRIDYWSRAESLSEVLRQLKRGRKKVAFNRDQIYEVGFAVSREWAERVDHQLVAVRR